MEDYKEIELFETQLRVYRSGYIWRLIKVSNSFGKKGEWKLAKGCVSNTGYLRTELTGKKVSLHRIIAYTYLGLDINDKKIQIDHKNRIRTDNRVENLEIVTNQQNQFNRSNTKGYSFDKKTGKYRAQIKVNRKKIHLGCYDTKEEASNAYQKAKLIHHSV